MPKYEIMYTVNVAHLGRIVVEAANGTAAELLVEGLDSDTLMANANNTECTIDAAVDDDANAETSTEWHYSE